MATTTSDTDIIGKLNNDGADADDYTEQKIEENVFRLMPVIIAILTFACFCVIICVLAYIYRGERNEQKYVQREKPLEQFIREEEESKEEEEEKYQQKEVEALNKDRKEVKEWLTDTVKLEMYFATLIQHGYECMDFIMKIEDKSELKSIGILKKGHQTRMMKQINNLKQIKSMNAIPNNNGYHVLMEEENPEQSVESEQETVGGPQTPSALNSGGVSIELIEKANHKRNFTVDTATSVVIPSHQSLHLQNEPGSYSMIGD